jgi:hypothetical protein
MSEVKQVGRLAMRVEGNWWTAYYALPDTMEEAFRLGQVHMSVVQDETRKQAFMDIFKSFIAEVIMSDAGEIITGWEVGRAPESERSGSA